MSLVRTAEELQNTHAQTLHTLASHFSERDMDHGLKTRIKILSVQQTATRRRANSMKCT